MELRSSKFEEKEIFDVPSWHYHIDDSPLTDNMKKFIMNSISDRLDKVVLDGSEENIIIKISLNPNEKIVNTVSVRAGQGNTRKRLCVHPHIDQIIDSTHN
jgi:hypothetical protein